MRYLAVEQRHVCSLCGDYLLGLIICLPFWLQHRLSLALHGLLPVLLRLQGHKTETIKKENIYKQLYIHHNYIRVTELSVRLYEKYVPDHL